jgi:two-component system OmpR family sensor kinase
MSIRTRLLVTYMVIIGLFSAVALTILPRVVENRVALSEKKRLQTQVTALAVQVTNKSRAINKSVFDLLDDLLTDETMAVVNSQGVVQYATPPLIKGQVLGKLTNSKRALGAPFSILEGSGEVIWVEAPIISDMPALQGWKVLLYRHKDFVKSIADPISKWLMILVLLGLGASMFFAAWVSRDMIRRLQLTGMAARSVAEGDLTKRAPTLGQDEITEMAHHFNHMADRIEALVTGLRRSEAARKELLIMVSHELRTPMTSIAGFAEALCDGVIQGEERKHRYYEIIANESHRMNRLINELFDVAKLDAGQIDLNLQAMSVTSWLVDFAESFQPGEAPLVLAIHDDVGGARIYGDGDRLDQVLANLAANALRYTPAGESVTIGAALVGEDVMITVKDQGPGLSPEDAARVFDRFYQGVNQGNGHKGAGLGLSIVKSLIEAHGGRVGVETEPGQGATFWVTLKRLPS